MTRKQRLLSTMITFLSVTVSGIFINSCPKPDEPAFLAPSSLTAAVISESEVKLSWIDNSDYEDGFKIERDSGGGFEQIAEVTADVTEYLDSDGLPVDSFYSYRVYAYAILKVSDYSPIATISTVIMTDKDGNNYATVKIGDQVWTAENLRVTQYRDGTPIPYETDKTTWINITTGAYCIYNDNASDELTTYGALYNWYAAADSRNIAPEGWHVPTDEEWSDLMTYLSNNIGSSGTADVLKSVTGWNSAGNGTDDYGFSALPGGCRNYYDGIYKHMGSIAYFWSATEAHGLSGWYRQLNYNTTYVYQRSFYKDYGFAIRLLRD